ncbi:threonine ammonia-lyase [Rhodococcus sp. NPDC058505]|uniref:threonine ammonia-lyase n=1 Tax=unclassified Rhodococcus (in: high G+C Gram-positive bacteria) TaxID=192944 RepID=UPI00365F5D68
MTPARIAAAERALSPVIRRTPLLDSRVLTERTGRPVRLKCENLQHTGSFKPRGAYNRMVNLTDEDRAAGVVAASAGNHAQGVAWAARQLGVAATVFMPVGASLPKLAATRAYGATVHLRGDTVDEALSAAFDFAAETGAVPIHPFDHPDVVAGQATVGLEILDDFPDVGTVLVPTGGGGLLAGVAAAIRSARPDVRIVGVQADQAAAWPASIAAGEPVAAQSMSTMADGIAVGLPGQVPFAHVTEYVDEVATVSEDALSHALLLCMERAKLIVEPAGAAAVAALGGDGPRLDGPVCAILSGGNIDPLLLTHVITHGLRAAGRYLAMRVRIPDRPGGLAGLLSVVGGTGASVVDVVHARTGRDLGLDEVEVLLTVETRGREHRDGVLAAIRSAGFTARVQE